MTLLETPEYSSTTEIVCKEKEEKGKDGEGCRRCAALGKWLVTNEQVRFNELAKERNGKEKEGGFKGKKVPPVTEWGVLRSERDEREDRVVMKFPLEWMGYSEERKRMCKECEREKREKEYWMWRRRG